MTHDGRGSGRPKKRKRLTPRTARTFAEHCRLRRDNMEAPEGWITLDTDGSVTICNQREGEESTGRVTLSRYAFNRFVDWYNGGKP